jgi:putative glutathione S-transferase
MGLLVDGAWRTDWYDTSESGGKFERGEAQFRKWISSDSGADFAPDPGRYHLYISHACPWANRTAIVRNLKGLQEIVSISAVEAFMGDDGWTFGENGDPINSKDFVREIYTKADPTYSGRVTVPILWDKKRETIVSNESAEIIRMFNSEFSSLTGNELDLYPAVLRDPIDEVNAEIYTVVNNGVYQCGFATTQAAYEQSFHPLFDCLDRLELKLSTQRYLVGTQLTEADIRLFTTLIRFDAVYFGHFKCNKKRIADYKNLFGYLCDLYHRTAFQSTIEMSEIKEHYYSSHKTINPTGVVPTGPEQDFTQPHDRNHLN